MIDDSHIYIPITVTSLSCFLILKVDNLPSVMGPMTRMAVLSRILSQNSCLPTAQNMPYLEIESVQRESVKDLEMSSWT